MARKRGDAELGHEGLVSPSGETGRSEGQRETDEWQRKTKRAGWRGRGRDPTL